MFRSLRNLLRRIFSSKPILALPAPGEVVSTPPPPLVEEEAWLDALIADALEGQRLEEIGASEFATTIQKLRTRGDDLLAGQWIEKFLSLPVEDEILSALRLELVAIYQDRGAVEEVLEHLQILAAHPEHGADAHYALAEHYRRTGKEGEALKAYEAVLALRVDYPNVKQRYDRLRAARGQGHVVSTTETMAGGGAADGSRYLLVRELGRGGAGVVYLARDLELERDVAVKLLHPHLAAARSQSALDAFFDEARVAASLRHPNIVAILDIDEKARRIVMELCDGGTLRTVLRDRGPRPLDRALERHAQLLSALDAAHARGIVHRDVKPGNLMFRRDPDLPGAEVVLGDFGIAHLPDAAGNTGSARALESKVAGTMAYMAPEQRQGEATAKSDLFSATVVLFEMLTGRFPWSREQLLAGVRRRGDFALPESITREHPRLQPLLQAHMDALGAPVPEERPDTTHAMKEARRLRDLAMVAAQTRPS